MFVEQQILGDCVKIVFVRACLNGNKYSPRYLLGIYRRMITFEVRKITAVLLKYNGLLQIYL